MIEPNATLYVKNIDWKIKKGLLRRALYSLFSRHGKVLEIIALRRDGLRGQAFVVMDSVASATAALQAEQGFTFFDKDLVIEYAKEKSDMTAKRDGTYVPKAKRRKLQEQQKEKKEEEEDEETAEAKGGDEPAGDGVVGGKEDEAAQPSSTEGSAVPSAPPSKYLLAQNLPSECNEVMLGMLFRQYAGYVEVRMPRPGLAFVEFESEPHATLAKQGLDGFQLTVSSKLSLQYGKS